MLPAIEVFKNMDSDEKVMRICVCDYSIKLIETSGFVGRCFQIRSFRWSMTSFDFRVLPLAWIFLTPLGLFGKDFLLIEKVL